MKTSQKLDQIFPNLILFFPFHQRWSYICTWNFKTRKQSKTKSTSEYKKIFGYLVCQNQALDYFHTSLLKELVGEIEGQVPQEWLSFCHKMGLFTWKLQWSECLLTGQSENDFEYWWDPTARKADANLPDCSPVQRVQWCAEMLSNL